MYRAIVSAANHPDPINPYLGLFNYRSIRALADRGVDLDVIAPRPIAPPIGPYSSYRSIPERHAYDSHDVLYPRFPYLLPQRLFRYTVSSAAIQRRVPQFLDRQFEPPDLCHAGHIHYDGYGLLPYCRKHDIPLTVMGRGKLLNNFSSLPKRGRRKIEETLTFAEAIICVSESLATIARKIAPETTVTVLANGADPDNYPLDQRPQIRSEIGIGPDERLVLFCGGFTERKGLEEMLSALDRHPFPNTTFAFVGHYGDGRDQLLRRLADGPQSSYRVRWKVPPLALRRWFIAADLFWLPSHAEGRPNTIYEAMAANTAVLATAVSGIPEQVVDGETGRLVPPRDDEALSSALADLLNDPGSLAAMGDAGRRRLLEQGWTWDSHGEGLSEIHRSVLDLPVPVGAP